MSLSQSIFDTIASKAGLQIELNSLREYGSPNPRIYLTGYYEVPGDNLTSLVLFVLGLLE